jgi:hypothetical protein
MYRAQSKRPLLQQSIVVQNNYTPEKIELIKLLSSYIKGSAKRDDIYTSLMKLKSSVSK